MSHGVGQVEDGRLVLKCSRLLRAMMIHNGHHNFGRQLPSSQDAAAHLGMIETKLSRFSLDQQTLTCGFPDEPAIGSPFGEGQDDLPDIVQEPCRIRDGVARVHFLGQQLGRERR